ncbi:MAG TPA: porin, partial [Anaeromyxobacteraceae bacterium]|nr:porin [Anaeromyxobacteraceae bacterium]
GGALGQLGLGYYGTLAQSLGKRHQVAVRYDVWTPDVQIDEAANPTRVFRQDELAVAWHTFLGNNLKLSAAYYHPMNGDEGPQAPDDPKADSFVAQLQAKF